MQKKKKSLQTYILQILNENNGEPISSKRITDEFTSRGMNISERTVRFHLLNMDQNNLTEYIEKKGRIITSHGINELNNSNIAEKIGFLSSKIDKLTYKMDFDIETQKGKIVVNISFIHKNDLSRSIPLLKKVFASEYSMGDKLAVFDSTNETDFNVKVPKDHVGIATVCSITVNGILLSYKIPMRSKYGGLLELVDREPTRFVALINYEGTTLDPLEIFIKSKMTDCKGAALDGNGLIGASFREIPADARDKIVEISKKLKKIGLNGFIEVGYTGQPVHEIPTNEGMIGCIIIGGLNPIAILEESGINVNSKAMSTLVDFDKLYSYKDIT